MLADWQVKAPPHEIHDGRFYEACPECDDPDHPDHLRANLVDGGEI